MPFSPTPNLDDVCINLYREADPKKKKDRSTLIGYVQIKVDQITARHPVERWYRSPSFFLHQQLLILLLFFKCLTTLSLRFLPTVFTIFRMVKLN